VIEVRNIIVHEIPAKAAFEAGELPALTDHVDQFVSALEWLVVETRFGKRPLTQAEINIEIIKETEQGREQLVREVNNIAQIIEGEKEKSHFLKTQRTWEEFIRLQAEHRAGMVGEYGDHPGTIAPLLYGNEIITRTKERIADLQAYHSWLKRGLDKTRADE